MRRANVPLLHIPLFLSLSIDSAHRSPRAHSTNCRCVNCQNMPPGGHGRGGSPRQPLRVRSFAADVAKAKNSTIGGSTPMMPTTGPDGSPFNLENAAQAAQNLTFLKNASPQRPGRSDGADAAVPLDNPALSYLAEGEQGGGRHGGARESSDEQPNFASRTQVISPDTEKKAGNVVSTLLMAASALTELHGTPPSTPSMDARKQVIALPSRAEAKRPRSRTPQRIGGLIQHHNSPMVNCSPKRKSSFESDCPTPKRQSSFDSSCSAGGGSMAGSVEGTSVVLLRGTASISLRDGPVGQVFSDAYSSSYGEKPHRLAPNGSPPSAGGKGLPPINSFSSGLYTPPTDPRKLKRGRLGSAKKSSSGRPPSPFRHMPPKPPTVTKSWYAGSGKRHCESDEDASDESSSLVGDVNAQNGWGVNARQGIFREHTVEGKFGNDETPSVSNRDTDRGSGSGLTSSSQLSASREIKAEQDRQGPEQGNGGVVSRDDSSSSEEELIKVEKVYDAAADMEIEVEGTFAEV